MSLLHDLTKLSIEKNVNVKRIDTFTGCIEYEFFKTPSGQA